MKRHYELRILIEAHDLEQAFRTRHRLKKQLEQDERVVSVKTERPEFVEAKR